MDFRWIDWNVEHATSHGVTVDEIETAIRSTESPYPEYIGDGKYRVYARGSGGRFIHIIFIKDDDGTIFVIHARAVVREKEKRRVKRKGK